MTAIDPSSTTASRAAAFADSYLRDLADLFTRIDRQQVAAFAKALLDARARGARIYFLGNGGSAATACHFANDLLIAGNAGGAPFRASSLADNMAIITATANDRDFREVFVRQLRSALDAGDVVIAISASGNSPNVLAAIEYANSAGAVTVGLTGFGGGRLRTMAQISVHVETEEGQYGPVEDAHLVLNHVVTSFLARAVAMEAR